MKEETIKNSIMKKIQNPFTTINQQDISRLLDDYIKQKENVEQKIMFLVNLSKELKKLKKDGSETLIEKIENLIAGQVRYLSNKDTSMNVDKKIEILSSLPQDMFSENLKKEVEKALFDQKKYKETHTTFWSDFLEWTKKNGLNIIAIALGFSHVPKKFKKLAKGKRGIEIKKREEKLPETKPLVEVENKGEKLLNQLSKLSEAGEIRVVMDTGVLIRFSPEIKEVKNRDAPDFYKRVREIVDKLRKIKGDVKFILPQQCLAEFRKNETKYGRDVVRRTTDDAYRLEGEGYITIERANLDNKEINEFRAQLAKDNKGNERLGAGDREIIALIKEYQGSRTTVIITSDSDIAVLSKKIKEKYGKNVMVITEY